MTVGPAAVTSPSLSLGDTVTLLNLSPVFLAVLAVIGIILLAVAQRVFSRLQGNFAQEI